MRAIARLLALGFVESFEINSDVRVLREPDSLATARQLYWLNAHGLLAVVEPGQVEPITKGGAAYAIDAVERPSA